MPGRASLWPLAPAVAQRPAQPGHLPGVLPRPCGRTGAHGTPAGAGSGPGARFRGTCQCAACARRVHELPSDSFHTPCLCPDPPATRSPRTISAAGPACISASPCCTRRRSTRRAGSDRMTCQGAPWRWDGPRTGSISSTRIRAGPAPPARSARDSSTCVRASARQKGMVLSLEVSRLRRYNAEWHQLLRIAAVAGTLMLDEQGIYDSN